MTRYCRLLFVLSLLLNMLLLGVVGGHIMRRSFDAPAASAAPALTNLPDDRAEALQQKLGAIMSSHKERRQAARDMRKSLIALLTADTFDAQAYRAEISAMQTMRHEAMNNFADDLTTLASGLSKEERIALAEMLNIYHKDAMRRRTENR